MTAEVPQSNTPALEPEALYGIAGKIIKKLEPNTESHPAGMLVELLMSLGSIIGHTAYFEVEDTRHCPNISAVRVGRTSKGRKGTASARIKPIMKAVDPVWQDSCVETGLSSGEGLIYRVRDEVLSEDGERVISPGVEDKRLMVYEGEFASVLNVCRRDGSTLSTQIRNAWDGAPLQAMTKNSPLWATGHHISVLGDITNEELQRLLSYADRYNGFANRFLWVFVDRTKLLPDGGDELTWDEEVSELKKAVTLAKKGQRMYRDRNAREKWHREYEKLSAARTGVWGAATSRAEAQVMRLALIYALSDCSECIRVEHLDAALALWRYCDESARLIFGGLSESQRRIGERLQIHPMTASEIREQVFRRNRRMNEILADLSSMVNLGYVSFETGERYHWLDSRLA